MRKWEVVKSEVLNDNPWLKLKKDSCIVQENGEIYDYYWVSAKDFAAIVGTTEDGQVVMIEQYRHGAKDIFTEFPAGVIEKDEDPIETAKRELLEETGFRADEFKLKKVIFSSPAALDSKGYLFFAKNLKKVDIQRLEHTENIYVKLIQFDELNNLIENGEIRGAFGTAATLLALREKDWFLK